MKLRINEKDTSMKYKTYGNVEKCFNILVNEKGYSKEEAQDIIDNVLADYKYNPNSIDSLLRRMKLILPKDEYKKEYGITERFTGLKEKETPNIEVKNKGILEVPEGKNVDDLPLSHFVTLANKKGLSKITKALNNLQVWNKDDDPKLSKWAGDMIDKLNKKLKKDESLTIKEDNNGIYVIKKDNKYVKDFSNGEEFTKQIDKAERFTNKKSANEYAAKYGKWYGTGYKVVTLSSVSENVTIKEDNNNKSYWKYYMNDPVLDEMYNDENYLDEKTVRKIKLYPCDNEKDCYEDDFSCAVSSYEYPDDAIFCTKEEAYKYLMVSWNTYMYAYIHDLL